MKKIQIVPYNNQDKISFWMSPKCILKNNQSESKVKKQSLTWGNEKVKRSVHHEQAPERVLYTIIYKKREGKALRLKLAIECSRLVLTKNLVEVVLFLA